MKKKIIFSNCIFLLSLLACTNELKEETSSLNTIPIDVISRPLKSTHLRDIARKQCPADFFNK